MTNQALKESLIAMARTSGLDTVGVCDPGDFDEVREDLEHRRREGLSGSLEFTWRDPAVSASPRRSWPWARSIVVAGKSYVPRSGSPARATGGRIARFATEDHYLPLRKGLESVAAELKAKGFRGEVVCDDDRLVDRAVAIRAGIGWWGKNTMVLTPKFGPWMLLGSVITDARLEPDRPMVRDCGTCSACLPACPTGALVAPGVLDVTLCLSAWAQAPGLIPAPMRVAMGNRVYGCDDCLEACPPGHRTLARAEEQAPMDLWTLLSRSDDELLREFQWFFIPNRRARYLRRNALIAVANVGDERATALLAGYLGNPDWLLRAHAAWGLGRLGGWSAHAALLSAAKHERNDQVKDEINQALAAALQPVTSD